MEGYFYFYLIAAASGTFALWNLILLIRSSPPQKESRGSAQFGDEQRAIAQQYRLLREKLHDYSQKIELVEEHSAEYSMALAECGWGDVLSTYGAMERVNNYLDSLVQNNSWSEIREPLSWFFSDRINGDVPEGLQRVLRSDAALVKNWDSQLSEGIEKAVLALGQSAQKTKSLGIQRTRKRHPTLVAVEKLFTMIRSEEPPVSG